jgi:hypothetical protein
MEIKNTAIGDNAGAAWVRANIMVPGLRNYALNVKDIQLATDKSNSAIRIAYTDGSTGVLSVNTADTAQQVVTAWKTLTGQTGAAMATDPVSAAISNLTNMSANVSGAAGNLSTATGIPAWMLIGAAALAAVLILPRLWRFIKTKILKRR